MDFLIASYSSDLNILDKILSASNLTSSKLLDFHLLWYIVSI